MRVHLRSDSTNAVHTTFTTFINGENCGRLTMSVDDACSFHQIIALGCVKNVDTFKSTGIWYLNEERLDELEAAGDVKR